jgi:hypothetical protein
LWDLPPQQILALVRILKEFARSSARILLLVFGIGPATHRLAQDSHARSTAMSPTLIERVRGEFIEMPGLQLTMKQAARLWGLDVAACRSVVEVLVESAFLRWTESGKIVRATT